MRQRCWSLILALVLASPASAQRVHGTVRDQVSHQPIAGAVVSVLDALGGSLARDLTNEVGTYSMALPAGADRVRVVRIGFRPNEVKVPPKARGDVPLDFTLEPLPSLLEKVTVSEGGQCKVRDDRAQALGLWEQARAGLLASVAARDARPGDMRTLEYRRVSDRARGSLLWQQIQDSSGRTSRPFVPIMAPADFAARGYLVHANGGTELGAPDADILLDDSFAATHCFSIAPDDADHAGEIGLAFDPAPGRDRLVDVRGVLWVDRAHPSVRTLEFAYTGITQNMEYGGARGMISFRSMENGVVFIDQWSISSYDGGARETASSTRVNSLSRPHVKVSGGVVTSARWDDGTHWAASTGSVSGRVAARHGLDSVGVRVWLVGTVDTTTTDSTGRFHFDGLLTGPYAIEAAQPVLASAGLAQDLSHDTTVATLDDSARAVVHLDSALTVARAVCDLASRDLPPSTLFLLRLVDSEQWYVPGDSVVATWTQAPSKVLGFTISHEGRFEGVTDNDGRVTVCDPPRGQPLSIVVGHQRAPQTKTTVTLPLENPVAVMTIRLPGS